MHTVELEHTTSTGHRIPNHQQGRGKCARLHGHTFGYLVQLSAEILDDGFVTDFGNIKAVLDRWDHRMILWEQDTFELSLSEINEDMKARAGDALYNVIENDLGIIRVPFIPTSENMAVHLAELFVTEFENVVFASVEVRESTSTKARHYCSKADVRRQNE